MALTNRLLKRFIRTSGPSTEYIAQGPSATGRSAPSAANSANSSVTATQLAEHLGDDIDLFSLGSVSEADHERQVQLKRVGEGWSNSKVDVGREGQWKCPLPTTSLIHLASHACNAVRPKPSAAPATPPGSSSFQRIDQLHSSLFSTAKATSFYRATTQSGPEGEEETVVVVVVRANGGLKLMDWMINGNFQLEEVGEDVVDQAALLRSAQVGSSTRPAELQAHAGFLHSATDSLTDVARTLQRVVSTTGATRVLFAGHSAGGAVVSLLFAHFLTCAGRYTFLDPPPGTSAPVSLDCITFGAPPVLTKNITGELKSYLAVRNARDSVFLALIVEGDPCPRLNIPYAKFLSDALRHVRPSTIATVSSQSRRTSLPIPPITAHTMGDLIMLRDARSDRDGMDIRMYAINEDMLANAAFTNLCVHFMHKHMELVAQAPSLRLPR